MWLLLTWQLLVMFPVLDKSMNWMNKCKCLFVMGSFHGRSSVVDCSSNFAGAAHRSRCSAVSREKTIIKRIDVVFIVDWEFAVTAISWLWIVWSITFMSHTLHHLLWFCFFSLLPAVHLWFCSSRETSALLWNDSDEVWCSCKGGGY